MSFFSRKGKFAACFAFLISATPLHLSLNPSSLNGLQAEKRKIKENDRSFAKAENVFSLLQFSFSARPLANATVKTNGRVEFVGHSSGLANGIFISMK